MKNLFNSVKMFKPRTNVFDLSHDVKFSGNMGELIPVMCTEVVPGDRLNIGCESLIRFQPLVSPVMHRMDVTMHYFFVPNRLVWPGWEKFIVGDPTAPAFPYIPFDASYPAAQQRLANYLGVPPPLAGGPAENLNAIPFAAFQMIWNEYYRDQNLIAPITYELANGDNGINASTLLVMRKRAWEHDYFTSALPFAQKGAAVDVPLGDVTLKPNWTTEGTPTFVDGALGFDSGTLQQNPTRIEVTGDPTKPLAYDPASTLQTEASTINELRTAFRLQEFLEKAARGGTRYIEFIKAMFGIQSSDKRLQRPEYITGTKSPVVISEVLNTTGTNDAPQGSMAGHGVSVTSGKYGNYFVEEFGYVIGVMSVMPKTAYQQGLARHWSKIDDFTQYYFPDFAHLGEQEVKNREVYAYQVDGDDTFGYVPRYAEYKFENNRVAGDFTDSLDFWHLGRIFASPPALNQAFVECDPTHRVFAVTDPAEQKLLCHVYNKVRAIRPMPKFGTPSF